MGVSGGGGIWLDGTLIGGRDGWDTRGCGWDSTRGWEGWGKPQ